MSISGMNIDLDDIETITRESYRFKNGSDITSSLDSNKRRNRRYLIILIIGIIIAMLTIAGVIIAIYALVLSKNNAETITTVTTSVTVLSTTAAYIECTNSPTTSYQYSTTMPVQCVNYTNNTDSTRNIGYTTSINFCDDVPPFNSTAPLWIRFLDGAGTLLTNSPVPPNRCGTVATGWYAGQYPIAIFSTATSIVCYYYTTNTCASCNVVSVTNCQNFYVFLLPEPPFCNYRYCTL